MEVNGQLHAPATLLRGKEPPWYPLDTRLGESHSQSRRGDERKKKKNNPWPCQESNPGCPARGLFTILGELPL